MAGVVWGMSKGGCRRSEYNKARTMYRLMKILCVAAVRAAQLFSNRWPPNNERGRLLFWSGGNFVFCPCAYGTLVPPLHLHSSTRLALLLHQICVAFVDILCVFNGRTAARQHKMCLCFHDPHRLDTGRAQISCQKKQKSRKFIFSTRDQVSPVLCRFSVHRFQKRSRGRGLDLKSSHTPQMEVIGRHWGVYLTTRKLHCCCTQ